MTRKDSHKNKKPKRQKDIKAYIKFVIVAILLMLMMDWVLWGGERPYLTKIKQEYYAEKAIEEQRAQEAIEKALPPKVVYPEDGGEYFEAPEEGWTTYPNNFEIYKSDHFTGMSFEDPAEKIKNQEIKQPKKEKKIKAKKQTQKKHIGPKAKIAIVIDDVGMNVKQSRAAINLDPNVTIAFLPYAETVKDMAAKAKANGNEMIIHTPMEAMNSDISLGSMALRKDMNFAEFDAEFNKIANSFDGYVGVNNHMGSALTQDTEAMSFLMDQLKQRDLYFLDSKTIHTSVAADIAAEYEIPFAVRDVFLDHEDTPEFVAGALEKLENVARRTGQAIAIGHPKLNTMSALQKWIPTMEAKGFELVPLSTLLERPKKKTQIVKEQSVKVEDVAPASGEKKTITIETDIISPAQWHSQQPE